MTVARPGRLIADCGGLIEVVVVALPSAFLQPEATGNAILLPLGNLLKALPEAINVIAIVRHGKQTEAQAWLQSLQLARQPRLLPERLAFDDDISPWIQDGFHVRRHETFSEIIARPLHRESRPLCELEGLSASDRTTALDGGNQLVGPDFRLTGAASLGGIEEIRQMDDRPLRWFGYRSSQLVRISDAASPYADTRHRLHQYGFHLDQFVSVTGLSRGGKPLVLVAKPYMAQGSTTRPVEHARQLLDLSAAMLGEQGFAVIRNPVPFAVTPDSGKRSPRLYNNVMLENAVRQGRPRPLMWLPMFSDIETLAEFDEANRATWEELGFEVVGVPGWSRLASRNGALRCICKVIRRLD